MSSPDWEQLVVAIMAFLLGEQKSGNAIIDLDVHVYEKDQFVQQSNIFI